MSERQEHKRRYNRKLEYIAHYEKWLENEPPMIRIFAWRKWKNNRPIYDKEIKQRPVNTVTKIPIFA